MQTSTFFKSLFTLALIINGLTLAQAQTKYMERKGGHAYTMEIPDYMVKTYELNDAATLQYYSKNREAYTIVIEDSKEELEIAGYKFASAEEFLSNFADDYKKDQKKRKLGKARTFEANGNQIAQSELKWTDEDGEFFMLITAIETKTHFYKVLCWTPASHAPQLKEDFKHLSASIKD